MHIVADTLDDLLLDVYKRLLRKTASVQPRKGTISEEVAVHLTLRNPRARLSRTESRSLLFGHLGEFLWYMSGKQSSKIIQYYIPRYPLDGEKNKSVVRSAYGPRILNSTGGNQLAWVIDLLQRWPTSRRAVIPIYIPEDSSDHSDVPCTCTLQFLQRKGKLHLITYMRSNDVYKGLPGDIFTFTMIQELVARALGFEVGRYEHMVGSLHLYSEDRERAERFVKEGWQQKIPMRPMPLEEQCTALLDVLRAEVAIRNGLPVPKLHNLAPYWKDIVTLLKIYAALKMNSLSAVRQYRRQLYTEISNTYIDTKRRRKEELEAAKVEVTQLLSFPDDPV